MFIFCDDIGIKHEGDLFKLEKLKKKYPKLKVNCAVIAKDLNKRLKDFISQDWVEVVVHGFEHDYPPECERDDKEERITKAYKILKPYLPKHYGFRAPGFQLTATTYPILKKLGFHYIAHQTNIQVLKGDIDQQRIYNTHIYDELKDIPNVSYELVGECFREQLDGIKLDIGCGEWKHEGCVGMDLREGKGVDIVHDLEEFPYPLEDESCSEVWASHILEHINPHKGVFIDVMNEVWRIMKKGGEFKIQVPYAGTKEYFQDPTHCNPCNEITFQYFDPGYQLYQIYKPSPWKIRHCHMDRFLEVILKK